MKITLYDLLGMIKDGKAPKKIKYKNCEYYLYDNKSYITTDKTRFFDKIYFTDLNIEVEILEKKKIPEKLYFHDLENITKNEKILVGRINSILDYLENKG